MDESGRTVATLSGRRAAAYWFSDGLPEVAFGSALAACGAAELARVLYFPYRWMQVCCGLTFLWLLALFVWDRKIIDLFKTRLTYPRTGYAQPPVDGYPEGESFVRLNMSPVASAKNNVTAFRMGTVYWFFLGSIMIGTFETRWSAAVAILAIACLIYVTHRWSEYPYSLWSVAVLAVSGILFCAVPLPERAQKFIPLFVGGLWLLCRGVWRMACYLRNNPRPLATESAQA